MTPNDTQMDVLMRRYGKGVTESSISTEHLDADEFNAFAEGALPAATRSRYVSHLADCGECRTVASQLTMAAGIGANVQLPASESIANKTWLQRLSALFSAPALRYAMSAVVLLAVVGVALVVWRRTLQQPNSALIARNEPNPNQVNAVNPPADKPASATTENTQLGRESGTNVQPTPVGSADKKGSESAVADAAAPPPPPAKDAAESEATSTIAADRAMKTPRQESTPSFAPPPPGENYRVDTRQREQTQQQQPNIAGAIHGGPRRNESQNKVLDDRRSIDMAKGRDEDRSKSGADQPASTANKQDVSASKARGSGVLASPSSPPKEADEARKSEEKGRAQTNEPTSVGGRKFRRQGSVWVDLKFKSSMAVITVARGSEEFAALDSKLRSIAQQLGGEVLVVHKGKAYRIR